MDHQIIFAGFGGQGILSMGRFIAHAGLHEGKHVSWLPSYGPEMRGGTANCNVIVSDEEVGSPIVSSATALVVMNQPSLEKFEASVEPGGVIILDSDLVPVRPERGDVRVFAVPATSMAYEMGNPAFAGVILLGKLLSETSVVRSDSFEAALKGILKPKKHYLIPEEMEALKRGAEFAG